MSNCKNCFYRKEYLPKDDKWYGKAFKCGIYKYCGPFYGMVVLANDTCSSWKQDLSGKTIYDLKEMKNGKSG